MKLMPKKFKQKPITPRNRTVPPVRTEEFKTHQFEPAPDVPPAVKLAKNAVCVNLPEEQDTYVRSQNKTVWLRAAVREKIERDSNLIQDSNAINPEQLQEHINAVLLSIPPRQRKEAARLFKKLTARMQSELSH